ncbi:MAG: STAS domain-containing protein [Kiritimatiellae bacterium]|jgi:anti-sigma B factor antagonist|nr:STAS domain-containing protein [Kiritimatiellia bacterium]
MPESKLNLEAEESNGVQVIHVNGPLDSVTFEQFKSFMEPRITQSKSKIVLDCQGLSYVNSRGLTLLVRYQRAAKQEFSFLGISGLNARAQKGMKLLGMDRIVKWYPTVAEALDVASAM